MIMAASSQPELVKPLLDAKSNVNATDNDVSSMMSCEHESSLEHAPGIHRHLIYPVVRRMARCDDLDAI